MRDGLYLPPGSVVGVLGGGQLGRMLGQACRTMGYGFVVFDPDPTAPAAAVADAHFADPFEDPSAVARFSKAVDVVTLEFENVPIAALEMAASHVPARPSAAALARTQDRREEKVLAGELGIATADFVAVPRGGDLAGALAALGGACLVKSARSGYDGKGQALVRPGGSTEEAVRLVEAGPTVVERVVDLAAELSVVVARGAGGAVVTYEPFVNSHESGVLDLSVAPFPFVREWSGVGEDVAREAGAAAVAVVEALDLVGVCCVEFFLTTGGDLLLNEIAPRPHNSGHLTIEAAGTSQFEQQLRAVTGSPLGSTAPAAPAAMANLLGDLWASGPPRFDRALEVPGVRLHLYGKSAARPGRKMGHLTATAEDPATAVRLVTRARAALAD